MENKSHKDKILDLLPEVLNAKTDQNWSGLIGAIAEEDDRLAQLIEDIREQFFVKTASRPYLDRLAANNGIERPRFVGMSDSKFRNYIPILSYQPKQVRQIINSLLDVFFLKEATTAFLSSTLTAPYVLKDGDDLSILVDDLYIEHVVFRASDFTSLSSISIDELVAAYNRQANFSYAIAFFDSVSKNSRIRIFTKTIGTQGSLKIIGGIANIGLQLDGFILTAGNGSNTQWTITKIGDETTFTHSGGAAPGLNQLDVGDLILSNLSENQGTFEIVSIADNGLAFTIYNPSAVEKVITQTSSDQLKFFRPKKFAPYLVSRSALVWETTSGKISVEMPATSIVVERALKGGFHLNGVKTQITSFTPSTATVTDTTNFPTSGQFVLEPTLGIMSKLNGGSGDEVITNLSNGRLISNLTHYSFDGISGNSLQNIQPDLPVEATLSEQTLNDLTRLDGIITGTVSNTFKSGDSIFIKGSSGIVVTNKACNTQTGSSLITVSDIANVARGQIIAGPGISPNTQILEISGLNITMSTTATLTASNTLSFSEDINGPYIVETATSTNFTVKRLGQNGSAITPGVVCKEVFALVNGSSILLTSAIENSISKITGAYTWDPQAEYTLSAQKATLTKQIVAGKTLKLLPVAATSITETSGFLIFDYGTTNQEGPVRFTNLLKDGTILLDPSYVFQRKHASGSTVNLISKGAHESTGTGDEYSPYITDPAAARLVLEELIKDVTSAGFFVDFLVRYPIQLYGVLSVYK